MEAQSSGDDIPLVPLQLDEKDPDSIPVQDDRELASKPALKDATLNGTRPPAKDGKIPNGTGKGRTNSLRRVKNSSELLRQRSLKRSKTDDIMPEGIGNSGGREGRHFTVSNVGHNGKIYLRYGLTNKVHSRKQAGEIWMPD
jgi:hypothetical protein